MPLLAAPTNKGASEMGPLEPSDSGTAPPSSKKTRTTTLSTTIKKSQLKSSNDKVDIEVVNAEVEGATANEEIKWSICRPEALGRRVQSAMWCHFKVFHHGAHLDKKGCVACILCFEAKNYDCGTICGKGGNTSGLIGHMKTYHIKHYDETMKGSSPESNTNGCQDITLIFELQKKQRYLGIGDAKELLKTAIASWMMDKGIPFSMVE
jgi:hypothetical protein